MLLRGLAADCDLEPGDCPLKLPAELLINSITARESDLVYRDWCNVNSWGFIMKGRALVSVGLQSEELLTVVWTMIDSHDPESPWHPFWKNLPVELKTGSSL